MSISRRVMRLTLPFLVLTGLLCLAVPSAREVLTAVLKLVVLP